MPPRTTWDKLSGSTAVIVGAFVLILLLIGSSTAVGLKYLDIKAATSETLPGDNWKILTLAFESIFDFSPGAVSTIATGNWSSISDAINAVLGIPTSLAGAVVAVALAHRAYVLAKRQVRYDSLAYVETVITNIERVYWDLANALRHLEREANDLYQAILRNRYRSGYKDERNLPDPTLGEPEVNIGKELEDLTRVNDRVDAAVEGVADAVLGILRDPLARAVWRSWDTDRKSKGLIPAFIQLSTFNPSILGANLFTSLDPRFSERHPHSLAQALRDGGTHFGPEDRQLLPKIISFERELRDVETSDEIIQLKEARKPRNPGDKLDLSRLKLKRVSEVLEDQILPKIDAKSYALRLIAHWNRNRGEERLSVIGALVSLKPFYGENRINAHQPYYNLGAAVLSEVIQRRPESERLKAAIKSLLLERGEDDPRLVQVAKNMIDDKGFEHYVSPWMIEAAEKLESKPDLLVYRQPSTYDLNELNTLRSVRS